MGRLARALGLEAGMHIGRRCPGFKLGLPSSTDGVGTPTIHSPLRLPESRLQALQGRVLGRAAPKIPPAPRLPPSHRRITAVQIEAPSQHSLAAEPGWVRCMGLELLFLGAPLQVTSGRCREPHGSTALPCPDCPAGRRRASPLLPPRHGHRAISTPRSPATVDRRAAVVAVADAVDIALAIATVVIVVT